MSKPINDHPDTDGGEEELDCTEFEFSEGSNLLKALKNSRIDQPLKMDEETAERYVADPKHDKFLALKKRMEKFAAEIEKKRLAHEKQKVELHHRVRNQVVFLRTMGATPRPHPAPLPPVIIQVGQEATDLPPQPLLKISASKSDIILQWDMPPETKNFNITGFEIYGYQENEMEKSSSLLWKMIGHVNSMKLPMSCTLSQFKSESCKYHFSIRAIVNGHLLGYYSEPASIMFKPDVKRN